jgi:polar amino acid transport system permease protein
MGYMLEVLGNIMAILRYAWELMPALMGGVVTTLKVFAFTIVLSIPLGILVALGRLSKVRILRSITQFYIWVMRGTPLLLQLIFIFFGLPMVGIIFSRLISVLIAFSLNYAAYYGEIFRGGIASIDRGQYEAAEMLGMGKKQTFIRVILPQVIKRTLPAVANEVITLVKDTSLVYILGMSELLRAAKIAANRDVTLVPLLVAGVFYLVLTAILTKAFQRLEDRYAYYE